MRQAIFSTFLFLTLLATGCSYLPSQAQKREANEIRFALHGDPYSLDPRIGGTGACQVLSRALFDSIMRPGKSGTPELSLASSYTLSEDKTIYTFTLRPSKWSNGQDLTASDFVYAWKSVINRSIPSPYGYAYFIIKNARAVYQGKLPIESVGLEAIDPFTLRITLEHPAPYFLELLCNPLFSPICQAVAEADPNWIGRNFVSNGPFLLDQHQVKSIIILKKNPYYWDRDSVKTERLSFVILEDASTMYNMFRTGALDWYGAPFISIPLEFHHELSKKGCLNTFTNGSVLWLICNTRAKPLSTPEVRSALALGINRTTICKDLLQNTKHPAFSFVPPRLSLLPSPPFRENVSAGKELFQKAIRQLGYMDGEYPSLSIMTRADCPLLTISQALQYQLQSNLKIDLQIESCDGPSLWSRLFAGKFDLALVGWLSWYDDPVYTLDYLRDTNNGINSSGWSSPEYKDLLDASDFEVDAENRLSLLSKAEALAMREMPIIPICAGSQLYAKVGIQGEVYPPTGVLDLKGIEREPQNPPHSE